MAEYLVAFPPNVAFRCSNGLFVPNDPQHPEFIAYKAWLDAGNKLDSNITTVINPLDPSWSWGADFSAVIGGQKTGGTNVG